MVGFSERAGSGGASTVVESIRGRVGSGGGGDEGRGGTEEEEGGGVREEDEAASACGTGMGTEAESGCGVESDMEEVRRPRSIEEEIDGRGGDEEEAAGGGASTTGSVGLFNSGNDERG